SRTANTQAASATRRHSDGATVPTHRYSDVPPAQKLRKLALTAQKRPPVQPPRAGAERRTSIPDRSNSDARPRGENARAGRGRDLRSPRVGHPRAAEDCPALRGRRGLSRRAGPASLRNSDRTRTRQGGRG